MAKKKQTDTTDTQDTKQGVGDIVDDLAEGSPVPNTGFIEAQNAERAEKQAQWAHLRDADGASFDPALHYTEDDGEPKLTAKGLLRKRRVRRSTADKNADANREALNARQQVEARSAGIVAANSLLIVATGFGGDEWNAVKDEASGIDERAQLQQAFGDYFVAKGVTDFPPGVALVLAIGMYAAPRFTMPKTQSKIGRVWSRAKKYLASVGKRRNKDESQSDSRDNGKRQNDDGARSMLGGEKARSGNVGPGPDVRSVGL